jgi:DUF971 family protein
MQSPLQAATAATDPKSVKVNLTTGAGVDIEWNDGHVSHYGFVYLRDACPCAMCNEEREKVRTQAGRSRQAAAPGALPDVQAQLPGPFRPKAWASTPSSSSWNDNHDLGIYSWKFLREVCPCAECKAALAAD